MMMQQQQQQCNNNNNNKPGCLLWHDYTYKIYQLDNGSYFGKDKQFHKQYYHHFLDIIIS